MTGDDVRVLRVLADNPARRDLLGLGAVARAVADLLCADNTEPITVGLHGPWGSGKSSLLGQVRQELMWREASSTPEPGERTKFVELNPWEFDDQEDVKGTIIATVLDELMRHSGQDRKGKLGNLINRISWTRAATAVARGALTMSWSLKELAEALTPRPESGPPTTLAGFRNEFADAVAELKTDRVVVLIDDLDRCLPTAVLSTLEAVKLFLAVPKMAFVIAADQDMVREAIAVGLGETRRSVVFARDYLDKIVQVPVGVPQPTQADAECYVALLLAARDGDCNIEAMVAHADDRRVAGETPYLAGSTVEGLTTGHLHQAQRIVAGLSTDDVVNPRRMKRFINALAVRQHTAEASGVTLDPTVIAKLYMLEHRFAKQMRLLAERSQTERDALLASWEAWAIQAEGESPDGADDGLKEFLAADPPLADEDTEKYFVLARKLLKTRYSSALSEEGQACIRLLLSEDSASRNRGVDRFVSLGADEREGVVTELTGQAAIHEEPGHFLQALILVGEQGVDPAPIVEAIRSQRTALPAGVAYMLVDSVIGAFGQFARELVDDDTVPELARKAIKERIQR